MNPDERIAQLERQVAELTKRLNALQSFTTIPFDVEKAFRNRLNLNRDLQEIITDITSEFPSPPLAQSVNEAGMDSYDVMTTPDYVLKVRLGNLYVGVPAFDF